MIGLSRIRRETENVTMDTLLLSPGGTMGSEEKLKNRRQAWLTIVRTAEFSGYAGPSCCFLGRGIQKHFA
jgi:hypothetical protein